MVDTLTSSDWKKLYHIRIRWVVPVSSSFDWKRALLYAEGKNAEIEAFCTWNKQTVKLVAPWLSTDDTSHVKDTFLIGFRLRKGVARDLETTMSTQGVCLHFVYDSAFELRAVRQTCLKRGEIKPCYNCEKRKRCDKQKYSYFLSKLDCPEVNDYLCMRVRGVIHV